MEMPCIQQCFHLRKQPTPALFWVRLWRIKGFLGRGTRIKVYLCVYPLHLFCLLQQPNCRIIHGNYAARLLYAILLWPLLKMSKTSPELRFVTIQMDRFALFASKQQKRGFLSIPPLLYHNPLFPQQD